MNVCLDACFLIGLYDETDQHHQRSKKLFIELFETKATDVAVILWPALYESISTRLVRHRRRLADMNRDIKRLESRKSWIYMDDAPYRDAALRDCFKELDRPTNSYRSLSLTDRVLRGVLDDRDVNIDGILTYNQKDFADICRKNNRKIML